MLNCSDDRDNTGLSHHLCLLPDMAVMLGNMASVSDTKRSQPWERTNADGC